MNNLAELLRELRGDESLRDVANRANISHSYLSHLEKGIDPRTGKTLYPTPEILRTLSKAYNYPYDKLMKAAGYIEENSDTIKGLSDTSDIDDIPPEGLKYFRKLKNLPPRAQKQFMEALKLQIKIMEELDKEDD